MPGRKPCLMGLHSKESSLANPGALLIVTGGVGAMEKSKGILAWWFSWLVYHHPIYQKVTSSVPGQGPDFRFNPSPSA